MSSEFLFVVCQQGAEAALKPEIARLWPSFRFAFSRPGFVTFKLPDDHQLKDDFDLKSVFARTYGFSLGKVEGDEAGELAKQLWELVGQRTFQHLHVWQRDAAVPGEKGFEPGATPLAEEVGQAIVAARSQEDGSQALPINRVARAGESILDCVLVEPNQWWIGHHRAAASPSRCPGGVHEIDVPEEAVSRAYLKMAEALAWSKMPMDQGDLIAELGSAPGGACQALLDCGLHVIGVDPAEMAKEVLARPHFEHIRRRTTDVRYSAYTDVRWLAVDLNVAPNYTLDAVEHVLKKTKANIRGMLLTLKMSDWTLAERIPQYIERIRSWDYQYVKARQLAHNRREICVVALRRRSMRREPPWKKHA